MVAVVGTVVAGPNIVAVAAVQSMSGGGLASMLSSVGSLIGAAPALATGALGGAGMGVAGALGAATVTGEAALGSAAAAGAVTGALSAAPAALSSAAAYQGAAIATSLAGPIGWAIVGADGYTWDCWKPVVMNDSSYPSRGIALRDLYHHPNLRQMSIYGDFIIAENIIGEQFCLSAVYVNGKLAFHATRF